MLHHVTWPRPTAKPAGKGGGLRPPPFPMSLSVGGGHLDPKTCFMVPAPGPKISSETQGVDPSPIFPHPPTQKHQPVPPPPEHTLVVIAFGSRQALTRSILETVTTRSVSKLSPADRSASGGAYIRLRGQIYLPPGPSGVPRPLGGR